MSYTDAELTSLNEQRKSAELYQVENKILYYKPCCPVHTEWVDGVDENGEPCKVANVYCPVKPCPSSKHWDFHMSDHRNRVVWGGNKAGKSVLGIAELVMMSCLTSHPFRKTKNPKNGFFRVYSEDFALIEKNIIPFLQEWIPFSAYKNIGKNNLDSFNLSFDKKYHILYLKGNRKIDFMTYEQGIAKSESVDLDGIMADEEMPEDAYYASQARMIKKGGRLWMTVTPLYKSTWSIRLEDRVNSSIKCWRIGQADNRYLTDKIIQDFAESIKDASEEVKQARLYGMHMEFQGIVFPDLDPMIHRIGKDTNQNRYPIIHIVDPHPRKATMMGWAYVSPKDDIVFFDELEIKGDAESVTRAIRDRERSHNGITMLRLIDPAARKQFGYGYEIDTLGEFERQGMDFDLADNSEAGYDVVRSYIKYDNTKPMSNLNRPQVFFSEDCPIIWDSLTHLMWDEWAHRNVMKDKKERIRDFRKDGADLVRYCLAARPTFRSFGNIRPMRLGLAINNPSIYDSKEILIKREINIRK